MTRVNGIFEKEFAVTMELIPNNADIIFYDYLVSPDIRALFPSHIPAHYVGKAKNQPINKMVFLLNLRVK